MTAPAVEPRVLEFAEVYKDFMRTHDPEILLEGPSGTGKTFAALTKMHLQAVKWKKSRQLLVRKTQRSLTVGAMVTLGVAPKNGMAVEGKVIAATDGVTFHGGSPERPAQYEYKNGSVIVIGGMDNAEKVLSTEFDRIYVNEANELSEGDWDKLCTRLRNNAMPPERHQIVADCNPPSKRHWLNQRVISGRMRRVVTRHEDNPGQDWHYVETQLATLPPGPARDRFYLGVWGGDDNLIYPHFDRRLHVRSLEKIGNQWWETTPSGLRYEIIWSTRASLGADYGESNDSANVAGRVDQWGRRWVMECWAAPAKDHGDKQVEEAARMIALYGINRGMVDPTQGALAGRLGIDTAKKGPGSRDERQRLTGRLLNVWPGGNVVESRDEVGFKPMRLKDREDSPGLLFVEGNPGIEELCDEMEEYHKERVETDFVVREVTVRKGENRVAALEYMNQALEKAPGDYSSSSFKLPPQRKMVAVG